jgi:hypothetical protein
MTLPSSPEGDRGMSHASDGLFSISIRSIAIQLTVCVSSSNRIHIVFAMVYGFMNIAIVIECRV